MKTVLSLAAMVVGLVSAQTPPNWFNATNGDVNCHARLLTTAGSTSIFYSCSNLRGTVSGTYVPAATNTATDVITVGLSAGVGNTGNGLVMIAVNATAAPVSIGSFGSVSAQGVVFQFAGGMQGSVSIAPAAIKGVVK